MLAVAHKTHEVVNDSVLEANKDLNDHVAMCVHLHMLAMGALLCRNRHGLSMDDCR